MYVEFYLVHNRLNVKGDHNYFLYMFMSGTVKHVKLEVLYTFVTCMHIVSTLVTFPFQRGIRCV